MRNIVVVALATTVLGVMSHAGTLGAQEEGPRPLSFGVAAGATIPVGDLGDFAGLGLHIGGAVHYSSPSFPLGLRGELAFANLGGKTVNVGTSAFDGPDTRILSALANVTYDFRPSDDAEGRGFPFVIAGLGLYNFRFSDSDVPGTAGSTTDFGINLGGGYRFGVAGLRLYAEARYHHVFSDEPAKILPVSIGVMF